MQHTILRFLMAAIIAVGGLGIAPAVGQAATQITTCDGLEAIDNDLSGSYVLANNINCEASWSDGFDPIGTVGSPFTGTLDGQGYIIDDPYIGGSNSYTGLFTATGANAVIKNFGVTRASITGGSYTGVLVGSHQGTIQNVYVEGSATTTVSYAGGLVGLNNGGDIINSYSHASVTAQVAYAGGLIGLQSNGGTI